MNRAALQEHPPDHYRTSAMAVDAAICRGGLCRCFGKLRLPSQTNKFHLQEPTPPCPTTTGSTSAIAKQSGIASTGRLLLWSRNYVKLKSQADKSSKRRRSVASLVVQRYGRSIVAARQYLLKDHNINLSAINAKATARLRMIQSP